MGGVGFGEEKAWRILRAGRVKRSQGDRWLEGKPLSWKKTAETIKQRRRNHSAEFKSRIAIEAIKGMKTVQQIAADNHLHPVQVTQ